MADRQLTDLPEEAEDTASLKQYKAMQPQFKCVWKTDTVINVSVPFGIIYDG